MIISFCKNTLNAFLGIAPSTGTHPPPPPPSGLISVTEDGRTPLNVLESASIKPSPKKDSGGGSVEITGGVGGSAVNGLSSCTESLGFESSEQMEESIHESARTSKPRIAPIDCRNTRCRQGGAEEKEFPPVLSSLKEVGGHYSTSFLKPVRENGRLTLTPVTIDRPEVFLASRRDGRLRLQFTKSDQESEVVEESGLQLKKIRPEGRGGEGLRRCQEAMSSHHHRYNRQNHLSQQLWNQQCVTSR